MHALALILALSAGQLEQPEQGAFHFGADGALVRLHTDNGTVTLSKGLTLSVVRASPKTCILTDGGLATLPNDTVCVESAGVLAEDLGVNSFKNSDTPATQTITLTTGSFAGWMDGTGSIAFTAGTATATGLPCTASSGVTCSFTVTVGGTVTATVSGSPTRAQLENHPFRSSYITAGASAATRQADQITISGSFALGSTPCFAATVKSSDTRSTNNPQAFAVYNASNDRWGMFLVANGVQGDCDYNNGTEFASITGGFTAAGSYRWVCRYDGANLYAGVGTANNSAAKTFTPTYTQTRIAIGWSGWAAQNYLNGWINDVVISNRQTVCK